MSVENYGYIRDLGKLDAKVLEEKGQTYGSSWRNRGGVGAFMMLARKWDRIENQCAAKGYDIFKVIEEGGQLPDGFLDDLRDLRRYLFLVDAHCTQAHEACTGGGYLADVRGDNKSYIPGSNMPIND